MRRRVVITGVGLRTPLGHSPEVLHAALIAGQSGVRRMEDWSRYPDLKCQIAAPVLDFTGKEIPRKMRRTMGRLAQFATVCAHDAIAQSGLSKAIVQSEATGVVVGSTMGSAGASEDFWRPFCESNGTRGIKGTLFFQIMSHSAATNVAMSIGCLGECLSANAACASGTQAIGLATDRIRAGRVEVMLAGGADELHAAAAVTFDGLNGASRGFNDQPSSSPRPFDSDRDGIVVGEGGGILLLESLEHAQARGATILGEILGYGSTTDAVNMASPAAPGMARAIKRALSDAGKTKEQVDYLNAHATGTRLGDQAEAEAIYSLFGDTVPVSSWKGHLGHTLGACGAIEAIGVIETLKQGLIPPSLNLAQPDVAPIYLPTKPLKKTVNVAISTSFAFGGVNTALVLGCFFD